MKIKLGQVVASRMIYSDMEGSSLFARDVVGRWRDTSKAIGETAARKIGRRTTMLLRTAKGFWQPMRLARAKSG